MSDNRGYLTRGGGESRFGASSGPRALLLGGYEDEPLPKDGATGKERFLRYNDAMLREPDTRPTLRRGVERLYEVGVRLGGRRRGVGARVS